MHIWKQTHSIGQKMVIKPLVLCTLKLEEAVINTLAALDQCRLSPRCWHVTLGLILDDHFTCNLWRKWKTIVFTFLPLHCVLVAKYLMRQSHTDKMKQTLVWPCGGFIAAMNWFFITIQWTNLQQVYDPWNCLINKNVVLIFSGLLKK